MCISAGDLVKINKESLSNMTVRTYSMIFVPIVFKPCYFENDSRWWWECLIISAPAEAEVENYTTKKMYFFEHELVKVS